MLDIEKNLGPETVHLFFGLNLIQIGYAWLFPKTETITVGWGNQINLIKNLNLFSNSYEHVVKRFLTDG